MRANRTAAPAQQRLHIGNAARLSKMYEDHTGRRLPVSVIRQLARAGTLPTYEHDRRACERWFDLTACMTVLLERDSWESGTLE